MNNLNTNIANTSATANAVVNVVAVATIATDEDVCVLFKN